MGNLASALFEGEERNLRDLAINESKLWAFNGQVGGYDVTLADVNLGDIVALRVCNETAWPQAMHLHGQHIWVNSSEFGQEEKALLRTASEQFEAYTKLNKKITSDVVTSIAEINNISKMSDVIASHLNISLSEKQDLLELGLEE